MDNKAKKIIAREGLVLLGIALVAIILAVTEPLAVDFAYFSYFFPLCITYLIVKLIFLGIRKFNLKINRFNKSGILISAISLLLLYFRGRVNYIAEPYPKIIEPIITILIFYTLAFALILLIQFIIWAIRTLKQK